MKCVLALSFLLAAVSADAIHGVGVAAHVVSTPTASQYHAQDELGQYQYGYSGPLSSKHEARSFDGVTRGGYSYVDGHGLVQSAEYVSDPHNGFRVAATNLPVGPGVPAPAVHHAAPAVAVHAAPAVAVHAAPAVVAAAPAVAVHAAPAVVAAAPIATFHAAPSTTVHVAPGSHTAQSSVVTPDGIVSHATVGHASVGPAVAHSSVVTHAGTSSVVSAPAYHGVNLAHALAHPIAAHSYLNAYNPYALSLLRRRRGVGYHGVALGHLPASTAPLVRGVALAAPAVHAYAAPAVHAYAAPAVHAYAAPAIHAYAPAAVSYSSTSVVHAAPAVHTVHAAPIVAPAVAAVHAAPVVAPAVAAVHAAPVASTRHHSQDVLGQYAYGYNDGVSAKEEVRTHDGVTRGAYSYVDPRGIVQSVHYAADGHGFRAAATNII